MFGESSAPFAIYPCKYSWLIQSCHQILLRSLWELFKNTFEVLLLRGPIWILSLSVSAISSCGFCQAAHKSARFGAGLSRFAVNLKQSNDETSSNSIIEQLYHLTETVKLYPFVHFRCLAGFPDWTLKVAFYSNDNWRQFFRNAQWLIEDFWLE